MTTNYITQQYAVSVPGDVFYTLFMQKISRLHEGVPIRELGAMRRGGSRVFEGDRAIVTIPYTREGKNVWMTGRSDQIKEAQKMLEGITEVKLIKK